MTTIGKHVSKEITFLKQIVNRLKKQNLDYKKTVPKMSHDLVQEVFDYLKTNTGNMVIIKEPVSAWRPEHRIKCNTQGMFLGVTISDIKSESHHESYHLLFKFLIGEKVYSYDHYMLDVDEEQLRMFFASWKKRFEFI